MWRGWLLILVALCLWAQSVSAVQVTINAFYPHGTLDKSSGEMYIRGNKYPLSWNQGDRMDRVERDQWRYAVAFPSNTTSFEFKVLVGDVTYQIGANVKVHLPKQGRSGKFVVNVYPYFYSMKGSIVTIENVESPQLKNTRDIVVYLPPSYYENAYKIYSSALVIMHDGQNLFNASTAFSHMDWEAQVTTDTLIVEGLIDEVVIIGVDNTPDRTNELTYSCDPEEKVGGKGDLYLDFIEQNVVPLIKSKFRVVPSRENFGILGSSLGGLISCYAGWTRSQVYGLAGCMSSSFWWNNEDFNNKILFRPKPAEPMKIYLDSGDSGEGQDDMRQTISVRDHMVDLGYRINSTLFYYLDEGGQHNEYFWGRRFWLPLRFLFSVRSEKLQDTN